LRVIDGTSTTAKLAVVLLDASRHGGPILSQCLSLLGFATAAGAAGADAEHQAAGEDGEAGGRDSAIVRLNEAILADLGSGWDRPGLFVVQGQRPLASAASIDVMVSRRYMSEAVAALRSAFAGQRRIVVDDPRVVLFPGLWYGALKTLGFLSRRVLVLSNPLDCAELLHRHHQLARPRALQLWLRYTMAALAEESARPEQIVRLDELRRRRAAAVFEIAGFEMAGFEMAGFEIAGFEMAGQPNPGDPAIAAQGKAQGTAQGKAIDAIIDGRLAPDLVPADVLFRRPLMPALVKDCYRMCLEWNDRDRDGRIAAVANLAARFEEHCLMAAALVHVGSFALAPAASPPPAMPAARPGADRKRCAIIHYHLFKNAGTSVDTILRRNFGTRWATREYERQTAGAMAASVRALLLDQPEIMALSSHTLPLPPPELPGVEIFPIIFIRHPLDRIKSAYTFEREQRADTEGARLAKQLDFAGYIRARLAVPQQRFCRNAQTLRLAAAEKAAEKMDGGSELERALRAAEHLPFVGSVEAFDASIEVLQRLLAPRFPGFQGFTAYANVSRPERSLDARIAEIRVELGNELFEQLVAANADDLVLYRMILARYRGGATSATGEAPEGVGGTAPTVEAPPTTAGRMLAGS
jgi:hypothetical protein